MERPLRWFSIFRIFQISATALRETGETVNPMIDPRLRNEHILTTAEEPGIGIVLLDVVLGHGSHPDPAEALAPAIADAMALAISAGRHLLVIASVCGTDLDPQGLTRQERILAQTGVMLESSNARAAMLAASIVAVATITAADSPPDLTATLVPPPLIVSAAD